MTNGILNTSAYDKRYIEFAWERASYSIENNTTTINWTLTARGKGNYSQYYAGKFRVTIDGTQIYYSATRIVTTNGLEIASGTHTIAHNTDGTKTISVSVEAAIYYHDVNCTGSDSFELSAIPRKATITAAPDITDEMPSATISYSNLAGAGVTSLRVCIDGVANYRAISPTGNSYTFIFTQTEKQAMRYLSLDKGSDAFVAEYVLETVIGGNTFYHRVSRNGTIVNAAPVLNPTAGDTSAYNSLTGSATRIIKGYNNIAVAANAEPQKMATIKSYSITNGAHTITTASGNLTNIETGLISFKVTDSRGLTRKQDITLEVVNYIKLSCNLQATIALAGEETADITLRISGNYFNGSFGARSNTLALQYHIKTDNGSYGNWVTIGAAPTISGNTYSLTHTIAGLDYRNAYTIEVAAFDAVITSGAKSVPATVRAIPVFDWSNTDFNFNVPIYINEVAQDYIVEEGEANGWRFKKWASGRAECYKSLSHSTAISNAWGSSMFSGTATARQSYPFAFTARPLEMANLLANGNAAWLFAESGGNGINGTYASASYNVCRPSAVTAAQTFIIELYVIGKWR